MERGGLVREMEHSTGAPQTGQYGASVATSEQQARTWAPDESAFDTWFQNQPFNRADVVMVAAIISVLLLANRELR